MLVHQALEFSFPKIPSSCMDWAAGGCLRQDTYSSIAGNTEAYFLVPFVALRFHLVLLL